MRKHGMHPQCMPAVAFAQCKDLPLADALWAAILPADPSVSHGLDTVAECVMFDLAIDVWVGNFPSSLRFAGILVR